jgi:hypothetical protein
VAGSSWFSLFKDEVRFMRRRKLGARAMATSGNADGKFCAYFSARMNAETFGTK